MTDPEGTKLPLSKKFFSDRGYLPVVDSDDFDPNRQVCARFKLNPGTYMIIPSTYYANKEADFLLRVFSEKESLNFKSLQNNEWDVDESDLISPDSPIVTKTKMRTIDRINSRNAVK